MINPVYEGQNDQLSSKLFYFYYMTDNDMEAYIVKRNQPVKNERDKVKEAIAGILNERGRLPKLGTDFGDLMWLHTGYILVVLESSGSLDEGNAVTFNLKPGGGNHSFRAGRDFKKGDLSNPYQNLSAFSCFNHMKHKAGHVLGQDEWERFRVKANHPHALVRVPENLLAHEDVATNLGPPRPQ